MSTIWKLLTILSPLHTIWNMYQRVFSSQSKINMKFSHILFPKNCVHWTPFFGNKMRLLYIFYTFKIYFVAPEYCTLGQKNLTVPDRNSNFALGYLCGGHIETFQSSLHTSKSGDLTNVCMLRKSEIIIEKLMNEWILGLAVQHSQGVPQKLRNYGAIGLVYFTRWESRVQ